jgi:glycosyltransferase involved in cell wall biosynthesis
MLSVSVVIPALNEAKELPGLLEALSQQTCPVMEMIVADAGSTDGTLELARFFGARVVPGGKPAVGRNAGAVVAQGDLFLFLDADVLPARDFVEKFVNSFEKHRLDAAIPLMSPLSERQSDLLLCDAANLYLQIVQVVSPHAPGSCILARRSVHQSVGGFDESVLMAEDHDYAQRIARQGRFGVVRDVYLPTSARRLEKEGLAKLALKYLYCELHALAGKPIHSLPFEYEFGNFERLPAKFTLVDIGRLRIRLRRLINPLLLLTQQGLATFETLVRQHVSFDELERYLLSLNPTDVKVLRRYLGMRQSMLRRQTHAGLARTMRQLQEIHPAERLMLLFGLENAQPEKDETEELLEK